MRGCDRLVHILEFTYPETGDQLEGLRLGKIPIYERCTRRKVYISAAIGAC